MFMTAQLDRSARTRPWSRTKCDKNGASDGPLNGVYYLTQFVPALSRNTTKQMRRPSCVTPRRRNMSAATTRRTTTHGPA